MSYTRLAAATLLAILVFTCADQGLGQDPRSAEIIQVYKGHTDTVESIALSPDGSFVATACLDHNVRLFEAGSGREIRTYGGQQGHSGQVLSVAFSSGGDQLASGGADNFARVWEAPVATPSKSLALSEPASSVAVAADGKSFAVAGMGGNVWVFPQGEEKGKLTISANKQAIKQLASGGNQWVSAGTDRAVRIWAADGKQAASYSLATADVTGLAVAGQSLLTTSTDGMLRTWQLSPQPARSFPGLKEAVISFYAHPDGNSLLFATADKTVTLGAVANATTTTTFSGPKSPVSLVTLSADSATVLAGCSDGTLYLWDRQGKLKNEFSPHGKGLTAAIFHPAQPLLITAGGDGAVKVWNLPIDAKQPIAKALKQEIKAHKGAISSLLLHPTTGQLITTGADSFSRFWDLAKPEKAVREIGPLASPVSLMTMSRDGQLLAGVMGKNVLLWNSADGKELAKLAQPADIRSLSLSADKSRLLLGRSDDLAVLHEIPSGTVLQTFQHAGPVVGVFVHPGGAQVVTASADKSVLISPIAVQRVTPLGGNVLGLAAAPSMDRVVTVGPGKECVTWLIGTGRKDKTFASGGDALAAAYSKDGQRIAVSGADGTIKLHTVADGKLVGSIAAGAPATHLAFHPTLPLLVGVLKNQAIAWSVATPPLTPGVREFGTVIQSFALPASAQSVAFTADGQFVTVGDDKLLRRFRIAASIPVKNLQHPNLVDSVAFDNTGNLLATGCHDGVLRIWDIAKGTPIKTINAHIAAAPQQIQNPIYVVLWTSDYKQLFSASYDRSIKLWDAASGSLVREFKGAPEPGSVDKKEMKKDDKEVKKDDKKEPAKKEEVKEPPKKEPMGPIGHRDAVFAIALSKDGKQLASVSSDGSLKLWDVATGKVLRDFSSPELKPVFPEEPAPSHPGWIHGVRFTPDGQSLVTAGAAPRFKSHLALWNVASGKRVMGIDRDYGPIHSLDTTADGTRLLLGCALVRGRSEAEAVMIKLPGK